MCAKLVRLARKSILKHAFAVSLSSWGNKYLPRYFRNRIAMSFASKFDELKDYARMAH